MICTLSKHEAEKQGYTDSLMLDYEGNVAEATGANIFFKDKNGELHTPIPDSFLDGITRRTVIEIAKSKNIKIHERKINPDELPNSLKENVVKLDLRQKLNVPFHLPSGILNSWSIKSFNSLYYHRIQKKENSEFVPLLSYFYPLDSVHQWNRIYGKKGFYQYQCVIPKKPDGTNYLRKLLQSISDAKTGSFLAILKLFGRSYRVCQRERSSRLQRATDWAGLSENTARRKG